MKGIVVVDKGFGIGKSNGLLFRLPIDMKRFSQMTMGNVIVVGYNTLMSFPNGKPLKNRTNIVLCPERDLNIENAIQVKSLNELFTKLAEFDTDKVFVCGGARLYNTLTPYCTDFFVTKVDEYGGAEVFIDDFDVSPDWEKVCETTPICDNEHSTTYCHYVNKNVKEFQF